MKKHVLWTSMALVALAFTGCDDEARAFKLAPGAIGANRKPAFAVQLRGKDAAGVGLLDEDGEIIDERYLTSGTKLPDGGYLHTDIAVPSNPDIDGVLAVIARTPKNYVLRYDYFNGAVVSELKTQTKVEGGEAAYSSNPYDYLLVNDDLAWVTRYQPNLDPDAKNLDKGDDLLAINPSNGKLERRVDLSSFYEEISYTSYDMENNELQLTGTAYARPNKLIGLAGDYAYVGLDRLTGDFLGAADGMGLVFNTAKGTFAKVEIEGMKNCGEAERVVGTDNAVIVSCLGSPWGSADTGGLAYVEVSDGKGTVKYQWRPEGADDPLAMFSPISLGGTAVAVTASGWATGAPDKIFWLDLKTGDLKLIKEFKDESDQGVVAFGGAYSSETGMLLIGDRGNAKLKSKRSPGVMRFAVDGSKVAEEEPLIFPADLPVDVIVPLIRY